MNKHVELNRYFTEFSNSEDFDYNYTWATYFGDKITWDKVLEKKCSVILGEAGSGKTEELKEQCKKLKEKNEDSFFFRIDQLINGKLENCLTTTELAFFERWKRNSNRKAYFFLDSIDETKLISYASFTQALINFSNSIPLNTNNYSIVLSCRGSEWSNIQDRDEISRILLNLNDYNQQAEPNTSNSEKNFQLLSLAPLDYDQVKTLSVEIDPANSAIFLNEVNTANAFDFVRRPQDAIELIQYFKEHQKLGNLSEIIADDIRRKLTETQDKKGKHDISFAELYKGSMHLAAATVLCSNFHISTLENGLQSEALNPKKCLPPSWSEQQIKGLLKLGIFDEATFNKIKFHHRRINEYLTAQYFIGLLENGCSYKKIKELFIKEIFDREVVVNNLQTTLPWLCIGDKDYNKRLFTATCNLKPALLVAYGDPLSLSSNQREQIFLSMIKKFDEHRDYYESIDRAQMAMFSSLDLSALIKSELIKDGLSYEKQRFLLRLVCFGRIESCLNDILQEKFLINTQLQYFISQSVHEFGDENHKNRLNQLAENIDVFTYQNLLGLFEALLPAPQYLVDDLVSLIERSENPGEYHEIDQLCDLLKQNLSSTQKLLLLEKLTALLRTEPFIEPRKEIKKISKKYFWLSDLIFIFTQELLMPCDIFDTNKAILFKALNLLDSINLSFIRSSNKNYQLDISASEYPHIQEWLFEKYSSTSENETHLFFYCELVKLTSDDFEWLILSARLNSPSFKFAIDVWSRRLNCSVKGYNQLKSIALINNELSTVWCKKKMIHPWLAKMKWSLFRFKDKVTGKYDKYRFRRYEKSLKTWYYTQIKNRFNFYRHIKKISNAEYIGYLSYLYRLEDRQEAFNSFERTKNFYGITLAKAAERGLTKLWRKSVSSIDFSKSENSYLPMQICSVQFDINSGLDWHKLNKVEVVFLTELAFKELNNVPDWLDTLASYYCELVVNKIISKLNADWLIDEGEGNITLSTINKLSDLNHGQEEIINHLIEKFKTGEPKNIWITKSIFEYLLNKNFQQTLILNKIAFINCQKLINGDVVKLRYWLLLLFKIDPLATIEIIKDDSRDNVIKYEFLEGIFSELARPDGLRSKSNSNTLIYSPSILEKLIPCVFSIIKPAKDIVRLGGGSYSPTSRDHAQDFRDSLIGELLKQNSHEATKTLSTLMNVEILRNNVDWLHMGFVNHLESRVQDQPWKENDIEEFSNYFEKQPTCSHQLFLLIGDRLDDIKDCIENSDQSPKERLFKIEPEPEFRKWLTLELNNRAKDKYPTPQQEVEVINGKKPDIRIAPTNIGPISLELKWAENWSFSELVKALEVQLVGQYLKAFDSNNGFFVLGYRDVDRKKTWKEGSISYNFESLIARLNEEAKKIKLANLKLEGLNVVGINFT